MNRPSIFLAAALFAAAAPSLALAKDPFCEEAKRLLKDREFIAKVPLYDTKIGPDSIIKLERDKEEIPKGIPLVVVDVSCEKNKVDATLKPQPIGNKVKVHFLFSRVLRAQPDATAAFEHMMDLVFEKP